LRPRIRPKAFEPEIGISEFDLADLFRFPPEGCQRRLFYRKLKLAPHRAEDEAHKAWIALMLEQLILAKHKIGRAKTDRPRRAKERKQSKMIPYLISLAPGLIPKYAPMLLDWLSPHEYVRIKTMGPSELLCLQLQHSMFVWNTYFAVYAAVCPSYQDPLRVNHTRDESIIQRILDAARDFWHLKETEQPPDAYPEGSRPCLFCECRGLCHGQKRKFCGTSSPEISVDVRRWFNLKEEAESMHEVTQALEKKIVSKVGLSMDTFWGTIQVNTVSEVTLDAKRLLRDHPEIKGRYVTLRPKKRLELKVTPEVADAYTASPVSPSREEQDGQTSEPSRSEEEQPASPLLSPGAPG